MPPAYPPSDNSHARLKAGGWSLGCAHFGPSQSPVWQITGTNGANQVVAYGRTTAEAYWKACEQAPTLGMLGRVEPR